MNPWVQLNLLEFINLTVQTRFYIDILIIFAILIIGPTRSSTGFTPYYILA